MFKQLLFFSVIILLLTVLAFYLFQRHLIYLPAKETPSRLLFHAQDMQEIKLPTSDGLMLNAWYKPAAEKQATVLYLHGNAGHIGHRMVLVRQLLNAGFGVLLLEYRGYGGNKGFSTEEGLYRDGRAAMQFLQQQGISSKHLVLYGESLGTGVATKLSEEYPSCSVVLQSPFTSLSAVSHYLYPWLFIAPWDKFDSLSRITKITAPLLILHGKNDQLVPFNQGLILYNQANQPKNLVAFDNKGHNDLWNQPFFNAVVSFIQTNCS